MAGAHSMASFPFTVNKSTIGYGTAVNNEGIKAEIWMPLWSRFSSYPEISYLFREGRVQFTQRRKKILSGFDFARAAAELGSDRGIEAFQRYAFIKRQGPKSTLAIPLGLFQVRERQLTSLIHQADNWLDNFSRETSGDRTPPRLVRAVRNVEESIFRLCEGGSVDQLREVLVSLGLAERELAGSEKFREDRSHLHPLQGLKLSWLSRCDDDSSEFSIAASLASIRATTADNPLRINIEPLKATSKRLEWNDESKSAVWGVGTLADNLSMILQRRSIDARSEGLSHPVISGSRFATLEDIGSYLDLETDDDRLEKLLFGLILIDWPAGELKLQGNRRKGVPSALPRAYALLKLLFLPDGKLKQSNGSEVVIRHEPSIIPLLRANRVREALSIAYQRLQSSGLTPATREFHYSEEEGSRLASSLMIPIDANSIQSLAALVLRNNDQQQ
jgi:CRISPR-associated protein Csx17